MLGSREKRARGGVAEEAFLEGLKGHPAALASAASAAVAVAAGPIKPAQQHS